MSKKQYDERKKKGLCVKCGKQSRPGKVCCNICAEKDRIRSKKNREFLKSIGICPDCGKNKLFGNEKRCPECLAKMYIVNKQSRERRKFNNSEWYKKDIAMLKEKGLCRRCRNKKVKEGHTYCEWCLIKKREESREYSRKNNKSGIRREERPSYGLCYTCGMEIDRDGRVCKKCAERLTANLPEKRDNKNWRKQNELLFKV